MPTDPSRPSFDDYLRSREVDVRDHTRTIEARFWMFHVKHPEVYAELVRLARQAHGRTARVGIAMLWERMRWSVVVEGLADDREPYALNNDYRSRYARLLMEREPDLADFFETREIRSA